MSLVPHFVRCEDGRWYKNLVYRDGLRWFLCFDDDDPPELVINRELCPDLDPADVLEELEFAYNKTDNKPPYTNGLARLSNGRGYQRCFDHRPKKGVEGMAEADAYIVCVSRETPRFPQPRPGDSYDAVLDDYRGAGEGVFYGHLPKGGR